MHVRLATPADAAAVAAIYAPSVTGSHTSFERTPPDAAEMARRIADTLVHWPWLVAEDDAGVLGYAYAGLHRKREAYQWSIEVSVYVHPSAHRRGVARTLYRALFRVLRAQGFVNVYAGIALPNAASVALHESLGMRPVGVYEAVGFKHGAWHDVGWWQMSLGERRLDPAPPTPLPEWLAAGGGGFELRVSSF